MINRLVLNEVSYFGPGAREVLPKEISCLGLHKTLAVIDEDLIKSGAVSKVFRVLEAVEVPYEIFSEIKPNPTVSDMKAGVEAFAPPNADFILAIGGGSSVDMAKAIGIIINNPELDGVVSLEGAVDTKKKSALITASPTTVGIVAEVIINYVVTDEQNQKRIVCIGPNGIPFITIVDIELMYMLPKGLTTAMGLDTLAHTAEDLVTKGAWEASDMFEIKAIEVTNRYPVIVVEEPSNAEAHDGMTVAQYIVGMAFSNVGLGVVYGTVHPLGAILDIPYGVTNALLLPIVMGLNAPVTFDKYVEIVKAMNTYSAGMPKEDTARVAVDTAEALSLRVSIPQYLSDLGIQERDLDHFVTTVFADICTPSNLWEVTKEIILDLYRRVLQ